MHLPELKAPDFKPFSGLLDQAEVETIDGRPAGTLVRQPTRGAYLFFASDAEGTEIYIGPRIAIALESLAIHAGDA
jgi:hypothetical protein